MRRCIAVIIAFAVAAARADDLSDARAVERAVQRAIAKAEPAIALVLVSRQSPPPERFGGPDAAPDYTGSGVVIDGDKRLVLTHFHVVRDATALHVRLPGRTDNDLARGSDATVIAADPRSDLAVLQFGTVRGGPVPALALGRGEALRKGSFVASLAHPFALGFRDGSPTASWGMIGNLRRRPPGSVKETDPARPMQTYGTLLQTDARLNLGSSGGALIDLDGELVGLTTATAALVGGEASGGFAVPMDANVRRIVDVLRRGEEVEYGFLGVELSNSRNGATLAGVAMNSPASHGNLEAGDTIVSVNGQPVRERDDLFLHVGAALAGQEVEIKVRRGRTEQVTTRVTLAKFPFGEPGIVTQRRRPVYGLRVDYTSVIARGGVDLGLPAGVVVRDVEPNSPAAAEKLVPLSTLIVRANDQDVKSPADFYKFADSAVQSGRPLRLVLANPPRTVTLK